MVEFHYIRLANEIEGRVASGHIAIGERLPSLRRVQKQKRLSLSTVYQAYVELENRGVIEARNKSGFYVRAQIKKLLPLPAAGHFFLKPLKVKVNTLAGVLQNLFDHPEMIPFSAAIPGPELLPVKQLSRMAREIGATYLLKAGGTGYGSPTGQPELQRQIARHLDWYDGFSGEEIIVTGGCMDAINLCLRAVASPGDIILVESPTFLCYLQLIEDLNMRVLELPADPVHGLDLDVLARTVEEHDVRAVLLNSNFPNPLGYRVAGEKKREMVRMICGRGIPVIEDDIYGELYFGETRPTTLKQYDEQGLVLYCSSFSKTVLPDLRVGWVVPGRFKEKVKRLKFNALIATPKLNQMIIAGFMETGAYERHLRKMRNTLKVQVGNMTRAVANAFPGDTRMSSPEGGLVLWVELNRRIDSLQLFTRAAEVGISILPGAVCSSSGQYQHCIRLNCGVAWSPAVQSAIKALGRLIVELMA
ncbi:MAG: PLP-dependent aminotransferase family protein [Proteobacteria bacterium]|jgi:DNA-binding transcriptional MocR family regulator|nr:PLP-dependent aminotransferase family protein [Pseudomonadota bacterium]MDO8948793.1 PLP-dependent aminotransferase family protein [Desulfocapsaceae bacterium]